jgi:hypothetical protein
MIRQPNYFTFLIYLCGVLAKGVTHSMWRMWERRHTSSAGRFEPPCMTECVAASPHRRVWCSYEGRHAKKLETRNSLAVRSFCAILHPKGHFLCKWPVRPASLHVLTVPRRPRLTIWFILNKYFSGKFEIWIYFSISNIDNNIAKKYVDFFILFFLWNLLPQQCVKLPGHQPN